MEIARKVKSRLERPLARTKKTHPARHLSWSDDPSTACRSVDYRELREGIQNLLVVKTKAASGLHERDVAEIYPIVKRALGHAEPTRKFIDVDERGRDGSI